MKRTFYKVLRLCAIVLMGLTAVFTILGGAGTTCVALAAGKFGEKFAPLIPYQWLYIFFVVATLIIGIAGVRALVQLIKRKPGAFRSAVIALIAGLIVGGVHMLVSVVPAREARCPWIWSCIPPSSPWLSSLFYGSHLSGEM